MTFWCTFPTSSRASTSLLTTWEIGNWFITQPRERDGVPTYELYNLRTDPYERHDLAAKHPRRVKRLRKMMCRRLALEQVLYPIGRDRRTLFPNWHIHTTIARRETYHLILAICILCHIGDTNFIITGKMSYLTESGCDSNMANHLSQSPITGLDAANNKTSPSPQYPLRP